MTHKRNTKGLKPQYSRWNNNDTIAVRIPKIFRDEVVKFARELDRHNDIISLSNEEDSTTVHLKKRIEGIVAKIEKSEKGYCKNNASKMIKEIKSLIE